MAPPVLIWGVGPVRHACSLGPIVGLENPYSLYLGAPIAATFPDDAHLAMDPDLPYDTRLTDNLANLDLQIIVSTRLKDQLEALRLPNVEYLPVAIRNHKNRSAGTYFVVHPLAPVDCLDLPRCGATFGAVDKDHILDLERLAIDPNRLDPRRPLFRPKAYYQVTLVTRELASALSAGGFTGLRWIEVDDYPEI